MNKSITRWGIGPQFTLLSVIYAAIILFLHYAYFSSLTFTIISRWINLIAGIILILIGLPLFIISGIMVHKYFNEGKLCTTGVYSYFRHPLYASWIVFIIPGTVLIIGSIIAITWPVFMYIIFRILIAEEDTYLKEKFGHEYIDYERAVNAVLPKLSIRKRGQ